jgi:nucleotide-binding universal stress UspA family protein
VSSSTIRVVGLNDFRKGLRGMDRGLPKAVRLALNDVANVLIDATRPKIPRRTGAAAASLKAASTQSAAKISVGGTKAPYYPWLDFGGRTGPNKSVARRFYKEGRYIYPTLAEQSGAIQDATLKAMAQLAATNGIEVS